MYYSASRLYGTVRGRPYIKKYHISEIHLYLYIRRNGTWRPDTIYRHSLYLKNLIGGLHCIRSREESANIQIEGNLFPFWGRRHSAQILQWE